MSLYNPYIVIPFATWAIAQVSKFVVAALRHKNQYDLRYLYASGGMPSAHSAVVCALAVTALVRSGVTSPLFGFTAVFAAIVMYDSFGVRRAAGEQAAAINAILDVMARGRLGFPHPQARLREILGHKPLEVTVGALVGVGLGLLFNLNFLGPQLTWLTAVPTHHELSFYLAKSLGLIIVAAIAVVWIRRRWRGSKVMARLAKHIMALGLIIGLVGLVLEFAAWQNALYLGWRLWFYVLVVVGIIWALILIAKFVQIIPESLAQESDRARIRRWLPGSKRRKPTGR